MNTFRPYEKFHGKCAVHYECRGLTSLLLALSETASAKSKLTAAMNEENMTNSALRKLPAAKLFSTVQPPATQLSVAQPPAKKHYATNPPGQKQASASKLPATRSPVAQTPGNRPFTTTGTKMAIPDASRIYKTTALKGNGNVPSGSFATRAMRAAMLAGDKVVKLDKSK